MLDSHPHQRSPAGAGSSACSELSKLELRVKLSGAAPKLPFSVSGATESAGRRTASSTWVGIDSLLP